MRFQAAPAYRRPMIFATAAIASAHTPRMERTAPRLAAAAVADVGVCAVRVIGAPDTRGGRRTCQSQVMAAVTINVLVVCDTHS